MIPASYFYKDLYCQTWLDPEINPVEVRQSKHGGGRPIRTLFAALLVQFAGRRPRPVFSRTLASERC